MKTLKKLLSLVLVVSMGTGLVSLTACGSKSAEVITMGDFTSLVVEKFGIESYQSEEPHVASVGTDSAYFGAVQGAYEWDIISEEDEYSVSSNLSKEYCAVMLTRAVGFDDVDGKTDEEIAQIAKDKGYITYDYRGHKDSKKNVSPEDAKASLDAAFEAFANHDFGAPTEDITYNDDVVVVGESEGYKWNGSSFVQSSETNDVSEFNNNDADSNDETTAENSSGENTTNHSSNKSDRNSNQGNSQSNNGNTDSGSENNTSSLSERAVYFPAANTIAIPAEMAENIKEGTTYVAPSSDGTTVAYKAETVEYQDGYAIITNESAGDFEDVVQEFKASGTFTPDLTAGTVRDGLGNIIGSGATTENVNKTFDNSTSFLSTNSSNCGKNNFSIDFSVGDLKIKGSVSESSIKFSVSGTLWKNSDGGKATLSKSYEIKDIKPSYDYDYSWFKLHSAYASISYTTVDTTSAKFSYKKTGSFGPEYTNGNGKFLTNLKRAVLKDSNDKGAKSIKICSVPLIGGGVVSLNLDVKINISLSGEITLTLTVNNTKGVRYKENSGIEFIKEEHKDKDLTIKAKLEITLYIGLSLRAIGFNLVGCGIEGGIGLEVSCIVHLADETNRQIDSISIEGQDGGQCEDLFGSLNGMTYNHTAYGSLKLHTDICFDVTTYWILKFTLDNSCEFCKLTGISASHEFFNKKNGKIDELSGHWEDGVNVGKCTRKYDGAAEEETTESEEIFSRTGSLQINYNFMSLDIGESKKIEITAMPNGYEKTEVTFSSSNSKVAKVDSNGSVTAVEGGSAKIDVKTKDGKYVASCSIFVASNTVAFETLPSTKRVA